MTMGTSLATVTIRLMAVASRTPRRIIQKNAHSPAEDRTTASAVSPSPSSGQTEPTVDMMSTQ